MEGMNWHDYAIGFAIGFAPFVLVNLVIIAIQMTRTYSEEIQVYLYRLFTKKK